MKNQRGQTNTGLAATLVAIAHLCRHHPHGKRTVVKGEFLTPADRSDMRNDRDHGGDWYIY